MEEEQAVSAEAAEVQEEVSEAPVEETEVAEGAPEETETPPPPRKKTAQKRIDEITKARREAEREKEYWKQQALNNAKKEERPAEEPTPNIPARPNLSQFDTTEEYEDALLAWHENRKAMEDAIKRQKAEQEEGFRKFQTAADAVRQKYPDFDEVVERPVFSDQMRLSILNSDTGPEMAYYLGLPENAEVAARIRSLSPERQIYEMGKLDTRLSLAQKVKKVPSAPPPITPVGMSGTGAEKDPGKMSIEEWMAWDKQNTLDKIKHKAGG